jgi:hypothetical protein
VHDHLSRLAIERLMAHWRRVLPPGIILDAHYEAVVADLEGEARRLLAHCGLPWDESCLAFYRTERVVKTARRPGAAADL